MDSARFAYPEGTGTISYDTTLTSPAVFIPELERSTGYRITPLQENMTDRPVSESSSREGE